MNDLPSEIICLVSDELDNKSVTSFSLTCSFIRDALIKTIAERKKIKEISSTMSNEELESKCIINEKSTSNMKNLYFSVLQNRKEKGILFRKGYYENGLCKWESWCLNGVIHRPPSSDAGESGGPATIKYYKNGHREYEKWWLNGEQHRPTSEGPADIGYYESGELNYESWFLNGERHRPTSEGPAYILYNENGHIENEQWLVDGERHRPSSEGPSYIEYYKNGQLKTQYYFENGINIEIIK